MRFGRKSFVISVIAFVLCLNFGFLSLGIYSYQNAVNTQRELCKIQYEAIVSEFEQNYNRILMYQNEGAINQLMSSFCERYNSENVYLKFFGSNGDELYGIMSEFDKTIEIADPNTVEETDDVDGNRYVMINSTICDGRYNLVYAFCINGVLREQSEITFRFAMVSVAIYALFTVVLYFAMRKSSRVLEQAVNTADAVASSQMETPVANPFKIKGVGWSAVENSFNNMLKTVNDKVDNANKNAEQKQMLVNHVANQLNMPLTSISRTADDILHMDIEDQRIKDGVTHMLNEAQRLQDMSQTLLDIAYMKDRKLNLVNVNVGAVLSDTAYRFSKYASSIGINIETSLTDMNVKADDTLLSVLFYNITDNAVKACTSGCTVTLACENSTVTIADNGVGLTKEQLERLTEPFYKAENTGDRGFGLGLALCKEIIDAHGATISFESEPGSGTKVTIDFAAPKN